MSRVAAEVYAPEKLDMLDSEAWYTKTSMALDIISVAGAVAATAATVKLLLSLKVSTGKTLRMVLKGLSRQERKRLAEEIVRIENRFPVA